MSQGYQHGPPFDTGRLSVGDIHVLHYDQYGRPDGKPVIFVHGGPGGETSIYDTAYFNPAVYRVVLFDQRGSGKSTPSGEIKDNTSQHLIADMETLRVHLSIAKWHLVFGGSWGSALSLMYAQAHPSMVGSLILRGIFTGRKKELEFHRGPNGAAMLFPEAFASFLKPLSVQQRSDPYKGYLELLHSSSAEVRRASARSFNAWYIWTSQVELSPDVWDELDDEEAGVVHAKIECHFFSNGIFLPEGELLRKENIDKIRHIPTTLIQGQYDLCTPPQTAWDLHEQWPESELIMVPGAGHSAAEPRTFERLIKACDKIAEL